MAYLDPTKGKQNIFAVAFMPLWYFRWIFFIGLAYWNWNSPRTTYTLFWIFDIFYIALSVLAMKGIRSPVGILFVVEEAFVFVWHFSQFILWVDYFKARYPGVGKLSTKATKFWVWLIFISLLSTIVLELVSWILTVFLGKKGLDKIRENIGKGKQIGKKELNNKVAPYNNLKSKGKDDEEEVIVNNQDNRIISLPSHEDQAENTESKRLDGLKVSYGDLSSKELEEKQKKMSKKFESYNGMEVLGEDEEEHVSEIVEGGKKETVENENLPEGLDEI